MELLRPTPSELAGWACVVFGAFVFIGLGRAASRGKAAPEAALVAGWGAASLVLTLWGTATDASMRPLAAALAAIGLGALAMPRTRLRREDWLALCRIAVVALPLFAVMASARPSEPDTFLNLLPNAAYLWDHGAFPAAGRAVDHSFIPVAPYNLQIAAYVAGLVTPFFPANALIAWNFLLTLAAALFIARLAGGSEGGERAPSWGAAALGLLLATLLNPGFVPRYHLAGYDELPEAVALLFAAWFAARAQSPVLLGLALAALVEVKQDGAALAASLLASAAFVALMSRTDRARAIGRLALAALPAHILFGAWRWYVATHMPEGELTVRPPAQWLAGELPAMAASLAHTIAQKFVFYGILAAVVAGAALHARRAGHDDAARMGAHLGGIFVLYTAALALSYIAVMSPQMAADAHSYFRYSTHLALLLVAAAVLLLRARWPGLWTRSRAATAAFAALLVAAPVAFLATLRFDLEPPDVRAWALVREAAPYLHDGARIALVLPGDNGSLATMLGTALRDTGERRPNLELHAVDRLTPATLGSLAAEGYETALISCVPEGFGLAPQGTAALLTRAGGPWSAAAVWPYAPAKPGRSSHVLAWAPLCFG
jgi:hypothetical protein